MTDTSVTIPPDYIDQFLRELGFVRDHPHYYIHTRLNQDNQVHCILLDHGEEDGVMRWWFKHNTYIWHYCDRTAPLQRMAYIMEQQGFPVLATQRLVRLKALVDE